MGQAARPSEESKKPRDVCVHTRNFAVRYNRSRLYCLVIPPRTPKFCLGTWLLGISNSWSLAGGGEWPPEGGFEYWALCPHPYFSSISLDGWWGLHGGPWGPGPGPGDGGAWAPGMQPPGQPRGGLHTSLAHQREITLPSRSSLLSRGIGSQQIFILTHMESDTPMGPLSTPCTETCLPVWKADTVGCPHHVQK